MKIDGEHGIVPPIESKTGRPEPEPAKVRRDRLPADAVEISVEGKAATNPTGRPRAGDAGNRMKSGVTQVRTRLQERIRNGFYDGDDVLQSVAGKILDLFGL